MSTTHYEPEMRETLAQGETWNATWLARGPAGQILTSATTTPSAQVSAYNWALYDATGATEEVAVLSTSTSAMAPSTSNPDGGAVVLSASTSNGYSRTSAGHTVHVQLQPAALSWTQVPGHTYRLEVELAMPSNAGGGYTKLVGHAYIRPWFGTE